MEGSTFILWRVPEGLRPWHRVILWWELRRIPYNIVVILSAAISLLLYSNLVKWASPVLFPVLFLIVVSNICYTGGWIVELVLRAFARSNYKRFASFAFKYGLLFSVILTFAPNLYVLGLFLTTGENPSPYARFTRTEPRREDILGKYVLSESPALEYLPTLELLSDGTFTFEDQRSFATGVFPVDYMNVPEKAIIRGSGTWYFKGSLSYDTWVLEMHFEKLDCLDASGEPVRGYSTTYYLQNDKPPYCLYEILDDPDSWDGNTFRRAP